MVGIAEVLSPFHAVTRGGCLVSLALVAAVAAIVWWARGRPLPPSLPVDGLRELRAHPLVCVLGGVVLLGLAYELAVGLTTPPTDWDAMHHHLVRAAAWRQRHAVEAIPNVNDTFGVNASPPDAEIQVLFGLVLLGRDTFATIPQFVAECALLVSVFGIARRVGFELIPSVFAALVTATLSDIALQSVAAQTDLCVAALVSVAVFFALGTSGADVALAGLAVGLALGTKVTAILMLPAIALVAFAVGGVRRVLALALWSSAAFLAFGAFIYLQRGNNAGSVAGVTSGHGSLRAQFSVTDLISTSARVLYRFVDLSGFLNVLHVRGALVVLVVVPAVALAIAAAPRREASPVSGSWRSVIAVACAVPIAAFVLGRVGHLLFGLLHIPANPVAATANGRFTFGVNVQSGEGGSYFGPLGAFLVLPVCVGFCVAWARGKVDRRIGALAAALPLFVLAAAATLSYTPYIGRYFIGAVAVAMPLTAFVYRSRFLARAVVLVGVSFLVLAHAFNLSKPIGLAGSRPIWFLSLVQAQTIERPALRPLLERVAAEVPQDASVGLMLNAGDWSYPFYGADLERTVTYLGPTGVRTAAAAHHLSWLIAHQQAAGGGRWRWRITRLG
jgi:hypothetical protein